MEEIVITKIEAIVKNKNYQELNKEELSLINKHFENEAEFNAYKAIISLNLDETENFPDEIDTFIFNKLNEETDKKTPFIFMSSLKNLAMAAMLILSFTLGYLLNLNNQQDVEIMAQTITILDTVSIEKEVFVVDTIFQNKIVFKEKIVKVFIEKETENLLKSENNINDPLNFDSIPLINKDFVENSSLNDLKDLSSFYTSF